MSKSKRILNKIICSLLVAMAGAAYAGYAGNIDDVLKKAEPWPAQITIPQNDKVTKEMYLQTADTFFIGVKGNTDYHLKQPKAYPNMGFHVGNALWTARKYQMTGDEQYAQIAAKCLEYANRLITEPQTEKNTVPGWENVRDLYWVDAWLKKSPAYTDLHRKYVHDIAVRACPHFQVSPEYGVHNRTAGAALTGQCLIALAPDAPDAEKWKTYADTIWKQFWDAKDTEESTDHYVALWFRYLFDWVQVRGVSKEFWADPDIKRMMERFLYQAFPMGSLPHYSDSCGWNVSWGHWVFIFESCATAYRDGRYKWAAHRIYNYGTNRIEKLNSWAYTGEEAGWSLVKAALLADDAIAEKPREKDVALLMRHKGVQRSEDERKRTSRFFDFLPNEMAPDKLVFYSGSDRDGLSMMVDVVGDAGHSHARRPTILALADHQSVLLMGLGYMDRNPEDHNIPQVIDYDGYPYENTPYHIKSTNNLVQQVRSFDLGAVGYGSTQIGNYLGYPAVLNRDLVFIKNVGVVVKDTVSFSVDLKLRWGSLYRVRNLGPDYGANWANTYLGEWIPLPGLGKNAAVLTRWHNSPRDLLIYYAPDKQAKLEVVDEGVTNKTCPLPLRVEYTLRQNVAPDAPVTTTTLLLPHPPGPGKPLADKVKVYLNEPKRTVMEFTDPEGAIHLVVINHSGTPIKTATLSTDAEIACISMKGKQVTAVALLGGKQLMLNGKSLAGMAKAAVANVVPAN
ncbi:MAG: hypothetical protein ACYDBB_05370 [Armatimonadota bacterium]